MIRIKNNDNFIIGVLFCSEMEEDHKRDTCNEVDTWATTTITIDTNVVIDDNDTNNNNNNNNNSGSNRRPRDYDGELLKPDTVDKNFFADFSVDGCLWDVRDRIDECGFVYIHQASGRPLAVAKTIDRQKNELNGYLFWFQLTIGEALGIAFPLHEKANIKVFLDELNHKYNVKGSWLSDIADDRKEIEEAAPNTEKDDDQEHEFLYRSFLHAVGVNRAEQEKRPKIVAKRNLKGHK